jgi:hypothetical protein
MELQVGVNALLSVPASPQPDQYEPRSQGFVVPVIPTMGPRTTAATGEEAALRREQPQSSTYNRTDSEEVHNVLRGRAGEVRSSIIEL